MTKILSFAVDGGMDLATPAITLPPGRVIAALNYEPVSSGYKRITGYERFDGSTRPSQIEHYYLFRFSNLSVTLNVGDRLINFGLNMPIVVSTAVTITSGSVAGGNAVGYFGGYFAGSEDGSGVASVGDLDSDNIGTTVGQLTSYALDGVDTGTGTYLASVISTARGRIDPVPGSGSVLGVWYHEGEIFAIRNNAGATAAVMHKATITDGFLANPEGWVAVTLALTFTFNSGGTTEVVPGLGNGGYYVEGETSSATAFVTSVTLTSGSWAGGDAAGTITLLVRTGTFQNGENLKIVTGPGVFIANVLTLTNAGTSYVLPAGGRYEFLNHNFYGATNLSRMYAVSGTGKAFVYDNDAETLAPITTGMVVDTPDHIAEHNGALVLSFPGGSVQFSTVGEPLIFDPITGSSEIAVGSDVTALISANKSTLAILSENAVNVLYGHDINEYQLETLTDEAGGMEWTAQKIAQVVYLDNGGIRGLTSTAAFGDFEFGSLSRTISKLLEDYRRDGIEPVCSWISRRRNQYWLMFNNGVGLAVSFNKKMPEILPFKLGFTPTCACSVEIDAVERIFLGSSDGYVYEFDVGTNFDGSVIEHYLRFAFNHFGAPFVDKRLQKLLVDLECDGTTTVSVSVDLDYGSVDGVPAQTLSLTTGGGGIDSLGTNELYFASQIETQGEVYIDGHCRNASLKISGSTSTEEPHVVTGFTYYVTPLEQKP